MAPPPVCQALFLSFQVSLPGSPGAGTTYLRHASLPVLASSAAMKSRTPRSPPAAPTTILSLTASGAAVSCTSTCWSDRLVSQATCPLSLSVAITRVGERNFFLLGVHAPDDATGVAGADVDLVDDAPQIDHVHKAVLDQRGGFQV